MNVINKKSIFQLVLLIVSVPALFVIPFYNQLGLDFQNSFTFQRCGIEHKNIYLLTGEECGDWGSRNYVYPPLHFWIYYWTRFVSFNQAYLFLCVFILSATFTSLMLWVTTFNWKEAVSLHSLLVISLLLFQYPLVFALERGNSDIFVLVLWTVLFFSFVNRHYIIVGILAGLLVSLKIYPIIGLVCVFSGVFAHCYLNRQFPKSVLFILVGGIVCVVAQAFLFLDQLIAFFQHFDAFLNLRLHSNQFSHTLFSNYIPNIAVYGSKLLLLLLWCAVSIRWIKDRPAIVFLGALAISTYFSGVSYDYNLITVYPLLSILLIGAVLWGKRDNAIFLLGVSGIFIYFTSKAFIVLLHNFGLQLNLQASFFIITYLQWAWLCSVACYLISTKNTLDIFRIKSKRCNFLEQP